MSDSSAVPSFQPSSEWYADWPYDVSTLVQVRALVTGPAAARAVQRFLDPLTHNPDAAVPAGASLYYQGGFTVTVTPAGEGDSWQIVLASAGQDGFDSLRFAADDLAAALRETPGAVRLAWHELPATRAEPLDQ